VSKKPSITPSHFKSADALANHVQATGLGIIDSREWEEEWGNRWVVYADLVAFASRSMRSEPVVLNNIVRFDRASHLASAQFPSISVRRFSDATFAIAESFPLALGFAVALSHACLAFNREFLARNTKQFFIHLIVPRITIACGRALVVQQGNDGDSKLTGVDPRNILAGSAIVKAYQLEKVSAGGLVTVDTEGIGAIKKLAVRGDNGRVTSALRRWVRDIDNEKRVPRGEVYFRRGRLADIPWLLMRPLQDDLATLWGASNVDSDSAIRGYLAVWDTNVREFYSPQNSDAPLETAKHAQAAIRHGIQSYQISHGGLRPRYQSLSEIV
jgi:hypothetical protein